MKLHYFDIYGRAEPIRMLLNHAKVEFEDVRHQMQDWPKLKQESDFEFAQLPVLYVTDESTGKVKQYNQTLSILRFLGKRYGYQPEDADEAWIVDSTMDATNDVINTLARAFWEKDEERKKTMTIDFLSN